VWHRSGRRGVGRGVVGRVDRMCGIAVEEGGRNRCGRKE
jgi:hypothetical protein